MNMVDREYNYPWYLKAFEAFKFYISEKNLQSGFRFDDFHVRHSERGELLNE